MRVVVQRVRSASVEVDGQVVSKINRGLLCLVGVKETDLEKDIDYVCKKILKTRVFPLIDQARASWDADFTLYARLKKPRPDFSKAMPPQQARDFYEKFVQKVKSEYEADRVKDGVFGAMMEVSLVNDGPVTFIIDSEEASS